jgi:energy-converting hydrogenase Eha subunit B
MQMHRRHGALAEGNPMGAEFCAHRATAGALLADAAIQERYCAV